MNRIKALVLTSAIGLAAMTGAVHAQFAASASELPAAAARHTTSPAADQGLTRAQVRAEIEQARRDGTLVTDHVTGKPIFAVDTSMTQGDGANEGKRRADVGLEIAPARRDGTPVISILVGKPSYGMASQIADQWAGAE